MVSSGIEPLIPALLARCLNQLGQETCYLLKNKVFCVSNTGYKETREYSSEDIVLKSRSRVKVSCLFYFLCSKACNLAYSIRYSCE